MKIVAWLLEAGGVLLLLAAIIGRFRLEPTVTIIPGHANAASSLVLLANAVFLAGILLVLLSERK